MHFSPLGGNVTRRTCTLPLIAFVDPDYREWLQNAIPPELQQALQALYGNELQHVPWYEPVSSLFGEGLDIGVYGTYLTDALGATHNQHAPFHGMDHHQTVLERGDYGGRVLQLLFGRLPGELWQAFLAALATHDIGHPGATFFSEANIRFLPPKREFPLRPYDTPVEVYAAWITDSMMEYAGFSPLARLVANYIIISSAFGKDHPVFGSKLQLTNIQPHAIFGTFMRAADVAVPGSNVTAINNEIILTYREKPAFPRPITWQEYIASRIGFLSYVRSTFDALDAATLEWLVPSKRPQRVPYSLTRDLDWRNDLRRSEEIIKAIRAGETPVQAAILRASLIREGVILT